MSVMICMSHHVAWSWLVTRPRILTLLWSAVDRRSDKGDRNICGFCRGVRVRGPYFRRPSATQAWHARAPSTRR